MAPTTEAALKKENPRHDGRGLSGSNPCASEQGAHRDHTRFGLIERKKPDMATVLRALGVSFNRRRPVSWQRVTCPSCQRDGVVLLRGGFNGEGRYRCLACGTKGDSIAVYQAATGLGFRQACYELGCWGPLA